MKTTERTVHFYDIVMTAHTGAEDVLNPSTTSMANMLSAIASLSPSTIDIKNRANVSTDIAQWIQTYSRDQTHILINRADKNVSDVAFKNFENGAVRKGNKTKDEGIDISSHVILKPLANTPKSSALITMGAGVTARLICVLLNLLTRVVKKNPQFRSLFYFRHPSNALGGNGRPLEYSVRYVFDYVAHKSATLEDALTRGTFVSMDLVAHEVSAFDAGGQFTIEEQSIVVKAAVPETVTGASIINGFRAFVPSTNRQYDKLRVRYKVDDRVETTTLNTNDLDAVFTRSKIIQLDPPQEQQQTVFSAEIIGKMQELL